MSVRKIRWLGLALLATTGAGLLALTSMMNPAFAFGDDTALVMGPSGFPVPPTTYVDAVDRPTLRRLIAVTRQLCASTASTEFTQRSTCGFLRHRRSRGVKDVLNTCAAGAAPCPDESAQGPGGRTFQTASFVGWV